MGRSLVTYTVTGNKNNLVTRDFADIAQRLPIGSVDNLFCKALQSLRTINAGTTDNCYFTHDMPPSIPDYTIFLKMLPYLIYYSINCA